jgi:Methylamine utilisation protein MauE
VAVARALLGILLVAMAVGQLSDLGGFVDIVATYQICGDVMAWVLAVGLIVAELASGLGLLVPTQPARRRQAATAALVVAAAWTTLAVQAFARGLVVPNCGCFGVHLGQELRWWVLLEDAEFLVLALWVRHAEVNRRSRSAMDARSVPSR